MDGKTKYIAPGTLVDEGGTVAKRSPGVPFGPRFPTDTVVTGVLLPREGAKGGEDRVRELGHLTSWKQEAHIGK